MCLHSKLCWYEALNKISHKYKNNLIDEFSIYTLIKPLEAPIISMKILSSYYIGISKNYVVSKKKYKRDLHYYLDVK